MNTLLNSPSFLSYFATFVAPGQAFTALAQRCGEVEGDVPECALEDVIFEPATGVIVVGMGPWDRKLMGYVITLGSGLSFVREYCCILGCGSCI